ncbi:MAG: hypothetical protein U9R60_09435 [Bacteroidota bacterium]|nr:hypothetical protein [Bacteroidota bacterium]
METLKRLILPAIFILALAIFGVSCSAGKQYCTNDHVKYQKKSRVKAYKANSNRSSYTHSTSLKKRYVLKK